jgi:hypothetical protein
MIGSYKISRSTTLTTKCVFQSFFSCLWFIEFYVYRQRFCPLSELLSLSKKTRLSSGDISMEEPALAEEVSMVSCPPRSSSSSSSSTSSGASPSRHRLVPWSPTCCCHGVSLKAGFRLCRVKVQWLSLIFQ